MNKRVSILFLFVLVLLLLSGCAAKPLGVKKIQKRATTDLATLFSDQEPVAGPITLYEAMARAIKYNLDYRLKLMEQALAKKQFGVAHYNLLPQMTVAAGYSYRNTYSGASSRSLITNQQSLEPSTAQDKDILSADVGVVWNMLDFGVSYVRTRQDANGVLIAQEKRNKVIQNILQDVRFAYWNAVGSEQLLKEMDQLMTTARSALDRSKAIEGQRLRPPREILIYQRELLENVRVLWGLVQVLKRAQKELAALMNISPGVSFTLAAPDSTDTEVPAFNVSPKKLEQLALFMRPELREEDYRSRIGVLEVRRAMMEMLPALSFDAGYNYDSNHFLQESTWWDVGTRVSWNIMNLFSGPANIRLAKTGLEVDRMRRKALSMAVVTQVHLALQQYGMVKQLYTVTGDLNDVYGRISHQLKAAHNRPVAPTN
jgi:outer membrane protein, multidrug efflux system